MRASRFVLPHLTVIVSCVLLMWPIVASGATEKILHSFRGEPIEGSVPASGLIADKAGNLYGTTTGGGAYQHGTVFKLTRDGRGGWTGSVLHSFEGVPDGAEPYAGLIFDSEGSLYGTTFSGGTGTCPLASTCGTVFKLALSASGEWTESVLYNFRGGVDGEGPYAGLTWYKARLYGTTLIGGGSGCYGYGCGTVFQLTPSGEGRWTEKILYSFTGGIDSGEPSAFPLAVDASGSLYGATTYPGNCSGCFDVIDSIFEVSPHADGSWTEREIHFFDPYGVPTGVVFDSAGDLYGTTSSTQLGGYGSVFKLSPSKGLWNYSTLYFFKGGADGAYPNGGLTFDASGTIYGMTFTGGSFSCNYSLGCGLVFELTPGSGGQYTYSVLHWFGSSPDGYAPDAGVILDAAGNIYGTTGLGGAGYGTVFEITP